MKYTLLLLFVVSMAMSCSTINITSDFDKSAPFANYKTYKFTDEALALKINDLNRNRLINAIETELAAKGFTKSDNPDVLIDIQLRGQEKQTATANTTGTGGYGYGYGYRYGWGGGFTTTTIDYDTYIEGTLFVDMIDVSKKQLVWQGRGTKTIDENASQATREKNINYAVKQIFAKYPPVIK